MCGALGASISSNDWIATNNGAITLTSGGFLAVSGDKGLVSGSAPIVLRASGDLATGAISGGSLLMDDRTEVTIDATSVEGSGLRGLRIGQRVRFDLVEEGGRKVARTLRIVTL